MINEQRPNYSQIKSPDNPLIVPKHIYIYNYIMYICIYIHIDIGNTLVVSVVVPHPSVPCQANSVIGNEFAVCLCRAPLGSRNCLVNPHWVANRWYMIYGSLPILWRWTSIIPVILMLTRILGILGFSVLTHPRLSTFSIYTNHI